MKLGIAKYFLPFFFVFNPVLIARGSLFEILQAFFTCAAGIELVAFSLEGYILGLGEIKSKLYRSGLLVAGILLGFPETVSDIIGVIISASVILIIFACHKLEKNDFSDIEIK